MAMAIKALGIGVSLVELEGSLDVSGAVRLEPELRSIAGKDSHLAVDLSAVGFVSSQGIRVLVGTAKTMASRGHKMVLVGPRPDVRKALIIMNIDKIIPLVRDTEEATQCFFGR